MNNEKNLRHEAMNKVRHELLTSADRFTCLYRLQLNQIEDDKREMCLQLLQKKCFILGLEDSYTKLAKIIRLKKRKSVQEENFLEFVKKNKLV